MIYDTLLYWLLAAFLWLPAQCIVPALLFGAALLVGSGFALASFLHHQTTKPKA